MSPTSIGSYQLLSLLGEGAFARVHHAIHQTNQTPVALKLLRPELWADTRFRARFEREVNIYRRLDHPGIVRFVDWGRHENTAYLALEFLTGHTLQALLEKSISRMARSMVRSVAYLASWLMPLRSTSAERFREVLEGWQLDIPSIEGRESAPPVSCRIKPPRSTDPTATMSHDESAIFL